jgi:hypothetical protein
MFRSAFQLLNAFLGSYRRVVPVSILGMRIHRQLATYRGKSQPQTM